MSGAARRPSASSIRRPFLNADDARDIATRTDDIDLRAYRIIRQRVDRKIRLLSSRRPPTFALDYRVPVWVPECGQFNFKRVAGLVYLGFTRDGYTVTWADDEPDLLHIDWSPS